MHGTRHSKGACILFDPSIEANKAKYFLSDNSGRIVLINLNYNGMELSLCNIYAPNDHADQLRFIEELNNYLIDKSELRTFAPKNFPRTGFFLTLTAGRK